MDKDEANERMRTLAAAYRRNRSRYDASRKELAAALPELLAAGVMQSEICRETGLTRERLRQMAIKAEEDARRDRQSQPRPAVKTAAKAVPPSTAPSIAFLSASDRTNELIGRSRKLPAGRLVEIVSWLEQHHWQWLKSKRRREHTDLDIVEMAIRDGLLTDSDLR